MTLRLPSLALAASAVACSAPDVVVGDLQEVAALSALPNPDLDVLFVIDNSPSMADKQAQLAASFPRMIDRLTELDGGLPNLHIGVVTSDMGTQGSAVATPGPQIGMPGQGGCAGRGDDGALRHPGAAARADGYLADVAGAGGRLRNYTGELADAFGQLARVGAGGCGFEQHLAALRRALDTPANTGFLRRGANLAVVILGDEDDCSALDPALFGPASAELGPLSSFRCFERGVVCDPDEPRASGARHGCRPRPGSALVEEVAPFVAAVLAQKPDPRQVMAAAIVGPPAPVAVELQAPPGAAPVPALAPSCTSPGQGGAPAPAYPAVRLAAFVDGFAGRGALASVCGGDLAAALTAIGGSAKRLIGDPCVDTSVLADSSPAPGVQPACEVTDVRDAAPDVSIALPRCDEAGGAVDCYRLIADAAACPASADHLRLRVQRASAAPADVWTHVRCQRAP